MIKELYLEQDKKLIKQTIINDFKTKNNNTILIYGLKTSCKTELAKSIFKELNYIPVFYNIFNENDIFKEIYNFNNNNFNNILNEKKNTVTKKSLIIDNVDFISLNIKKKNVKSIIIQNLESKKIPIIIITKDKSNKILEEIYKEKKKINKYLVEYSNNTVIKICNEILDLDIKLINIICEKTNFNMKIIINIYNLYKNTTSSKNDLLYLESILSLFYFKTEYITIFDSLTNILTSQNSNQIKYYYDKDKVILPLILHENYIKLVDYNTELDIKDKIVCIDKISKIISFGDSIETFIYTDQNWILHNSHCFITCVLTSYLLNPFIDNKENINKESFTYSTELNKTSLMNINKKNISNIIQLTNLRMNEIFYLNYLLNNLIENSLEKIVILLKDYINLNKNDFIKLIDMILKIDKTYSFKNISLLQKKNITNLLINIKSDIIS